MNNPKTYAYYRDMLFSLATLTESLTETMVDDGLKETAGMLAQVSAGFKRTASVLEQELKIREGIQ